MLVIADRIDATRKHIAQAITAKNASFIQSEVKAQAAAGADCVGIKTGGLDGETELLKWVVQVVKGVTDLPLCLDYRNPDITGEILPLVGRKPFLNTIRMSRQALEQVIRFAVDYRVRLIFGNHGEGTPNDSWEPKAYFLNTVINQAKAAGFRLDDLYIDINVSSLPDNSRSAIVALDVLQRILQEFPGVHTLCDLSIISRGLPGRKVVDRTFLSAALVQGLDSAIMDPTDKQLYGTVKAALLVAGKDEGCTDYLKTAKELELD